MCAGVKVPPGTLGALTFTSACSPSSVQPAPGKFRPPFEIFTKLSSLLQFSANLHFTILPRSPYEQRATRYHAPSVYALCPYPCSHSLCAPKPWYVAPSFHYLVLSGFVSLISVLWVRQSPSQSRYYCGRKCSSSTPRGLPVQEQDHSSCFMRITVLHMLATFFDFFSLPSIYPSVLPGFSKTHLPAVQHLSHRLASASSLLVILP